MSYDTKPAGTHISQNLPNHSNFGFSRGLATPTLPNYINIIAPSETRATVLSIRNFIVRGLFALLGPLFGWLTDRYGLTTAMFAAGLILGSLAAGSLVFFLRFRTYQKE